MSTYDGVVSEFTSSQTSSLGSVYVNGLQGTICCSVTLLRKALFHIPVIRCSGNLQPKLIVTFYRPNRAIFFLENFAKNNLPVFWSHTDTEIQSF